MAKKEKPNQKMKTWIDARKCHRLSHAQVQMARQLGGPGAADKIAAEHSPAADLLMVRRARPKRTDFLEVHVLAAGR
jgi:hypothetical protein